MKKVNTALLIRLCLPQFAVGLFTTMLNNYLIYFYQPSKESGIPNLIPQGRIVLGVLTVIGLIKAVGHIIDAVTDPLIAAGVFRLCKRRLFRSDFARFLCSLCR